MRSDIQPGATFPDYELPDHENIPQTLSELQGDDPLILTLARGQADHHGLLEVARGWLVNSGHFAAAAGGAGEPARLLALDADRRDDPPERSER